MAEQKQQRELTFENLEEVVAEAERLASGQVVTTGNHTFGQILNHLALSQDVSTGRIVAPPPPLMMRLMRPLIRLMVVNSKPLKPGIKLPAEGESFFWPDHDFDVPQALDYLKESTKNYKSDGPLAVHPFFGKLSKQESDRLNCQHAALHLSFVHPA